MDGSELTFDGSRVAHRAIGPGSLVASRFRLEDLLEEHSGGARFWRATDLTLARNVAVHVIPRDSPRAEAVLTAARTSATVSDPRILRVLDAVEEETLVHIVHEWGSGTSLDKILPDEVLEPRRAAWLVREVAEAIAVAHRHGIAHGRLLPENVLITDVGSVKLIGFVVDAVLHGRAGGDSTPLSEHESDVLNLGALLYACLTGKWAGVPECGLQAAPYDHERVCRPRQVRHGVPKQLDALCDQILNPSPRARRFETAVEIAAALSEFLGDSVSTPPVNVSEVTAFLDPAALRSPESAGTLGSYDEAPADSTESPGLDETQPGMAVPRSDGSDTGERTVRSPVPPAAAPVGATAAPVRPAPEPRGERRDPATDGRPGSTWWRLAAVIGVLALVLLAVLLVPQLGGDSGEPAEAPESSSTPSTSGALEVVEPASVDDFDPDGGAVPDENDAMVPLATDRKPGTAWETKTYFDGPVLAPYRSGVGLLVDLGEEVEVRQVSVLLVGGPYDLELLAAEEGTEQPPASADGLATVEARSGVAGEIVLRGDEAVRTRYLVVWLTALPRSADGYRGGIAEVVVRS
jgi:hypothetical protein